jgi:hypothetical protein
MINEILDDEGRPFTGTIKNESLTLWIKNGLIHRENDLPAELCIKYDFIIYMNYYKNGLLHREKGPARVTLEGHYYYLNGIEFSKEKHSAINKIKEIYKKAKEMKQKFKYRQSLYIMIKKKLNSDIAGIICDYIC